MARRSRQSANCCLYGFFIGTDYYACHAKLSRTRIWALGIYFQNPLDKGLNAGARFAMPTEKGATMRTPDDLRHFNSHLYYDKPRLPRLGTVLTALLLALPFIVDRFA